MCSPKKTSSGSAPYSFYPHSPGESQLKTLINPIIKKLSSVYLDLIKSYPNLFDPFFHGAPINIISAHSCTTNSSLGKLVLCNLWRNWDSGRLYSLPMVTKLVGHIIWTRSLVTWLVTVILPLLLTRNPNPYNCIEKQEWFIILIISSISKSFGKMKYWIVRSPWLQGNSLVVGFCCVVTVVVKSVNLGGHFDLVLDYDKERL